MKKTVTLNGKSYKIIGKPEDMPMSLFNPARKLTKAAQALGKDDEATKAFYMDNMDNIIDVADGAIRFALGDEQFTQAQGDIEGLSVVAFCTFGFDIMNKYSTVAG